MDYEKRIIDLFENGYLNTSTVVKNHIPKVYLTKLVRNNIIKRIGRGLYSLNDNIEDEYLILQSKSRYAVFSNLTSLYFHKYSDRIPNVYDITVPYGYQGSLLQMDNVRLYYVKKEYIDLGVTFVTDEFGNKIKLYDLERTICDIIKNKNKLDAELVNKAARNYFYSNDKNKDSLKALANNLSKKINIPTQYIIQNFMFESLLKRISKSKYKEKFIIKGGLLLSSFYGVDMRSTMDMDATIKGLPLDEKTILKVIEEIIHIDINDGIDMEIVSIKDIRTEEKYSGYKVNILAGFDGLKNNLLIDITAGDIITYKEIEYSYKTIFDAEKIDIMSYNFETIIAEKYESIISRNIDNTRMKDYYDLFMFTTMKWKNVDKKILIQAIYNTSKNRETEKYILNSSEYISLIKEDTNLRRLWKNYQASSSYAKEIQFEDAIKALETISELIVPTAV